MGIKSVVYDRNGDKRVTRFHKEKRPHRCPVCAGCGTVAADFYQRIGSVTDTSRQTCRSCDGKGIVWEPS